MQRRTFTPEERQAIMERIEQDRSGGMSAHDACKAAGIVPSLYSRWKHGPKPRKRREVLPAPVVHHTFPIDTPPAIPFRSSRGITIKGSPEDLGAFLRAVANGGGKR